MGLKKFLRAKIRKKNRSGFPRRLVNLSGKSYGCAR
jgi:hypothetical protein